MLNIYLSCLSYIRWNPNPNIFEIGGLKLSWYGTMWGLGIMLGYYISLYIYRKQGRSPRNLVTLIQYVALGALIGARLGQVIFYESAYFSAHPLEIFQIWKGGMASHGAAIGTIVGVLLYTKKYKDISFFEALDGLAIIMPMAAGLVRIGNLFNSEIVGKTTTIPWAFIFEQVDTLPRHPSQLYDAILVFSVSGLLFYLFKKYHQTLPNGLLTGLFFSIAFSLRLLLEFFKADATTTQWLNVPVIVLGIALIFWSKSNKVTSQL